MSSQTEEFTIGVEEEYQIINPVTREFSSRVERAARYGLDEDLIDVAAMKAVRARDLVESFLAFVRPSLEEYREWDEVSSLVHETMQQRNGATRQREVYKRTGRLEDVVDLIVRETAKGVA